MPPRSSARSRCSTSPMECFESRGSTEPRHEVACCFQSAHRPQGNRRREARSRRRKQVPPARPGAMNGSGASGARRVDHTGAGSSRYAAEPLLVALLVFAAVGGGPASAADLAAEDTLARRSSVTVHPGRASLCRGLVQPTNSLRDPGYVGSAYGLGRPSYYGMPPALGTDAAGAPTLAGHVCR